MSDLTFAEKDAQTIEGEALQLYTTLTGKTLAAADPRRLFLRAFCLLLAQQRTAIDFSAKQNLLKYVSGLYIADLAALLGEAPLDPTPSTVTLRFTASAPTLGLRADAGKRVTDGRFVWAVDETTIAGTASPATEVICTASCTVGGTESNGVAVGFIDTIVDSMPAMASVENITESSGGKGAEDTEAFRERLRTAAEDASIAGPRGAYEAVARKLFPATLEDIVALGTIDDASIPAGNVVLKVMQVGHPSGPTGDFLNAVEAALSAEDVRPLTDQVDAQAPSFVDFDLVATYYIARSRQDSADQIQAAVEAAWESFKTWQRKIGRDVNPSQLIGALVAAGAKRVVVTNPAYAAVARKECSRLNYEFLGYGGLEDD